MIENLSQTYDWGNWAAQNASKLCVNRQINEISEINSHTIKNFLILKMDCLGYITSR